MNRLGVVTTIHNGHLSTLPINIHNTVHSCSSTRRIDKHEVQSMNFHPKQKMVLELFTPNLKNSFRSKQMHDMPSP